MDSAASPAIKLDDTQRIAWLRLMMSENVGPVTFRQLINRYGGAEAALDALPDLTQRVGRGRAINIFSLDDAQRVMARLDKLKAKIIGYGETNYPQLLQQIDTPPPMIILRGNMALSERPAVAIVGSRNASALGQRFCGDVARALVAAEYPVVSGLARGIDTAAHQAAGAENTIAVVAGGLDVFYPPENRDLQCDIANEGLLVSEMLPGTKPRAELFPRRNRIIAGLSKAVVVVEAAMRSGSLITARLAVEQNREVYAVPGSPLDNRASGCNKLIRNGAAIVTSVDELIEDIDALTMRQMPVQNELFEEDEPSILVDDFIPNSDGIEKIVNLLSVSPVAIDDLVTAADMPVNEIIVILLELELAGRVSRQSGQRFSLASDATGSSAALS